MAAAAAAAAEKWSTIVRTSHQKSALSSLEGNRGLAPPGRGAPCPHEERGREEMGKYARTDRVLQIPAWELE